MTLRTMFTAVSGLRTEGEAIAVTGDNLANVSTTGFKRQRSIFEDVLGRSALGTGNPMAGAGVRNAAVRQEYSQGALLNTGIATDLALTGDGFFTVRGTVNGITGDFFSRAGQFTLDADGYLVDPGRMKVVGYLANPDGTFQASLSPLKVPTASISPNPTTQAQVTANLDADSPIPTLPWDAQDPANTSNFSTTMTVYDSLGQSHGLDVYFRRTAAGSWDYHALVDGAEVNPPAPGTNVEVGAGSLSFTTDGALDTFNQAPVITADFTGATAGQTITLDLGTPISAGGTGYDGTTQFASPSNVSAQGQDGYASGDLSGIAVEADGTVVGKYTNGSSLPVGRLAIAKFRANEALARAGNNLWLDTNESGPPAMGVASSGGRGAVSSGALEGSNVDMAQEMVDLIRHQRAYGANSKTITTADDMLAELMTIKR